ncbi:MAG: hypothetical protein R3A48_06015 [Polyangiales bacterium]
MLMGVAAASCSASNSVVGGVTPDAATVNDLGDQDVSAVVDSGIDAPDVVTAMDAPVDASRCGPGQLECGGNCVSSEVDPANCGACGRACADTERCTAGACVTACAGSQTACPVADADGGARGNVCVLTDTDRSNCGACGRVCPAGQVCSSGMCTTTCSELLVTCTGDTGAFCADTRRDPLNGGSCGRACAPGRPATRGAA